MDSTTQTAHAVVVTRADIEAQVRFGPLAKPIAEQWAANLRLCLPSMAPHGTTVYVAPWTPGDAAYVDPESIPASVEALMEPFLADEGAPENGGFPDLHARLIMRHGRTRASEMWTQACDRANEDDAYNSAVLEAEAHRLDALERLAEAISAATKASAKVSAILAAAWPWDFTAVADDFPRDASVHLDDALRSLRAAARVLKATREA